MGGVREYCEEAGLHRGRRLEKKHTCLFTQAGTQGGERGGGLQQGQGAGGAYVAYVFLHPATPRGATMQFCPHHEGTGPNISNRCTR